jgi:hypothetical protein
LVVAEAVGAFVAVAVVGLPDIDVFATPGEGVRINFGEREGSSVPIVNIKLCGDGRDRGNEKSASCKRTHFDICL